MLGNGNLPLRNGPDAEDIQGDVLAAFNKDHRSYLFLNFPDGQSGRAWLKDLLLQQHIATTREVAAFNMQFSAVRRARGGEDSPQLKATWINVSFTYQGLTQLFVHDHAKELGVFTSFVDGPVAHAQLNSDTGPLSAPLHDPATKTRGWVVGAHQDQNDLAVHALLNIQADDAYDLDVTRRKLQELNSRHGVSTILEQRGDTLPGARHGHEHFGFKDGISQPGIEGFDIPDPAKPAQVFNSAGTEIIAAGEFLLGYPLEASPNPGPPVHETLNIQPAWMKNGSFQVFRRLEQDVPSFWGQVGTNLQSGFPLDDPMTADQLAAKLVGRWRSGTPMALSPSRDDHPGSVRDNNFDNDFNFHEQEDPGAVGITVIDKNGVTCPRFAHIRKVNTRDNAEFGDRHRRILRRGVPFGPAFDPADGSGHAEDEQRGLLFVAYMHSIQDQFEFLQQKWVDSLQFPFNEKDPGVDPIIGLQKDHDELQPSPVKLHRADNLPEPNPPLSFTRWVHTTGALYSFVPSIRALHQLAGIPLNGDQEL